ncbi:MAG: YraN family protein [Bacteroidetes bacterium]|nr:YraN family protein [Bacteroidota bacterium]
MSGNKKQFGESGEELASDYLIKKGYKIIKRNWRFSHGEIDIIAKDNNTLVFVEVKTRRNLEFGPPELAVPKSKQIQIKKMAEAYLYINEIKDQECRIDVIAILMIDKDTPQINHIKNAF